MKKILTSSIAALAFACTLTGCGNNSGKTSVSENPPATNAPSVTVTEQALPLPRSRKLLRSTSSLHPMMSF